VRTRTVGKAKRHDVPAADTGNDTQVDEEKRGGNEPVHITGNEELPADKLLGCEGGTY